MSMMLVKDGETWHTEEYSHEVVYERVDVGRHDDRRSYYLFWTAHTLDVGVSNLTVVQFENRQLLVSDDPDSTGELWEFGYVEGWMPLPRLERLIWGVGRAKLAALAERQNELIRRGWDDCREFGGADWTPFDESTLSDYRPVLRRWFEGEPAEPVALSWLTAGF
jgi:hypothetical protein